MSNSTIESTVTNSGYLNDLEFWNHDGTIYAKIYPATARNIVTTLFLVLNVLIAIVGEYFLKRRNQRRLILRTGRQAKTVPFQLLTPWLSLSSCATYFWKTRALPGGWLGLLMFASGGFGLIQHYTVNSFILPVPLPTWCDFDSGLVTIHNTHQIQPSPAWPAALLVFSAHTAVKLTEGVVGIYDKVNSNTIGFRPTTRDVLGTWNCTSVPDSKIQPGDWVDTDSLYTYLDNQNFVDYPTLSVGGAVNNNDGQYQGFMAWSGIFDNSVPYTSWEIQASIANGLGGNTSKPVSNYRCNLIKTVDSWTPTPMPTNETLDGWKDIMFGFVSQVRVSTYPKQLTTVLNAMSMLAGSGNQNNLPLPQNANPQYGCVLQGAQISIGVWLIGTLLLVILVGLLVADLYQLIRWQMNKRKKLVEDVPTDLISWQLNMMRRMTGDRALRTADLKRFEYVFSGETGDFEFLEMRTKAKNIHLEKQRNNESYVIGDHPMEEYAKSPAVQSYQTLLGDGQYTPSEQDLGGSPRQLGH